MLELSTGRDSIEEALEYYAIPETWLRKWQKYIQHSCKRTASKTAAALALANVAALGGVGAGVRGTPGGGVAVGSTPQHPGPLAPAVAALLCPCHPEDPLLKFHPPHVTSRRKRQEEYFLDSHGHSHAHLYTHAHA